MKFSSSSLSPLGLGLSSIAGLGSRKAQERLLYTAVENGITYFDTAPYYGSGDAERIIGSFARSCPTKITIATKAGLAPALGHPALRFARQCARTVFRLVPGLKRGVRSATKSLQPRADHTPEALRRSVECSLRQLGVERLDVLLLHDWPGQAALAEGIVAELASMKAAGMIGASGLASGVEDARRILRVGAPGFEVLQFENSLLHLASPLVDEASRTRRVNTHRALAETQRAINALLAGRPDLRALWERELGVDVSVTSALSAALLEWATRQNPRGTVLFSTTKPERVVANAAAVTSPRLGPDGCRRLEHLFAEEQSVARALLAG